MWPFREQAIVPPQPPRPRGAPAWDEILRATAQNLDLELSPEWVARVSALCKAEPDPDAAIDIAQREFDHLNLSTLDRAILSTRSELRRLRQRRRRMAARVAH